MPYDKTKLHHASKHKPSSQRWLRRQIADPYVQAAKVQNFRSRAAFKLLELDERFRLLKKNMAVLDLGAAPGGWSEVAVRKKVGKLVGVDLLPIKPIEGAVFIQGDFTDPATEAKLLAELGCQPDLIMSDMAPNTTGHPTTDYLRIMDLAEQAMAFTLKNLAENGSFVIKLFQGGAEKAMIEVLRQNFKEFRHAKPEASRKDSRELYLVATGRRFSEE